MARGAGLDAGGVIKLDFRRLAFLANTTRGSLKFSAVHTRSAICNRAFATRTGLAAISAATFRYEAPSGAWCTRLATATVGNAPDTRQALRLRRFGGVVADRAIRAVAGLTWQKLTRSTAGAVGIVGVEPEACDADLAHGGAVAGTLRA